FLPVRYHSFFSFIDTASTEIYTLSLHDALPIFRLHQHEIKLFIQFVEALILVELRVPVRHQRKLLFCSLLLFIEASESAHPGVTDRKSTRLNSSHVKISYAVFCLKKKTKNQPYQ